MIEIVICEDEKVFARKARDDIKKILEDQGEECKVKIFLSEDELISKAMQSDFSFDMLFMDIGLKTIDGIRTAEILKEKNKEFILIFLSHMEERVFESFKARPFWFVRKEKMEEELPKVLRIAMEEMTYQKVMLEVKNEDHLTIAFRLRDIMYFQSFGRRIHLYTAQEQEHHKLLIGSISEYERRYADLGFVRAGKSHLVNIRYINGIGAKSVQMKNGAEISLGRDKEKVNNIRDKYLEYLKKRA